MPRSNACVASVQSESGKPPAIGALTGIRVVDFSTRLPGPLASLILAEAGAEVIKIERPDTGDDTRAHKPALAGDGATFALLNRGKRSVAIDLKDADAAARLAPLIASADVVVEQFRPGVMERLRFGYKALRQINPRLIYCSITGYGSTGPLAQAAGHDVNFLAETGMLGLVADGNGAPPLPPALIADVAGGAYPAVMNILLALRLRDRTGEGCHLDIAMCDSLFAMMHWALAQGWTTGRWPRRGDERLTGGSPRYQIHRTSDDRFIACSPLEEKFWKSFCAVIGLAQAYRDGLHDDASTRAEIARIFAQFTADEWMARLSRSEIPCSIVRSPEEAVSSPHFRSRGLFDAQAERDGVTIPALPLPVVRALRVARERAPWPRLGEDNDLVPARLATGGTAGDAG